MQKLKQRVEIFKNMLGKFAYVEKKQYFCSEIGKI